MITFTEGKCTTYGVWEVIKCSEVKVVHLWYPEGDHFRSWEVHHLRGSESDHRAPLPIKALKRVRLRVAPGIDRDQEIAVHTGCTIATFLFSYRLYRTDNIGKVCLNKFRGKPGHDRSARGGAA